MSVILPLDKMTTEEKLQAMEALWIDLTQDPENFESPSWHGQVLKERDERLTSGQERLIDWEIAKKQLREK